MKHILQIIVTTILFYQIRYSNGCGRSRIFHYSNGTGDCYDIYRRGPCPYKHFLLFVPGDTNGTCARNPCLLDGLVPFQGGCHYIGKFGPPCKSYSQKLSVNEKNFNLECIDQHTHYASSNFMAPESSPKKSQFNLSNSFQKCESGFLIYPKNNSCYEAYRQGPCATQHYLILPPGETEARCVKNPCLQDGVVPFQESCYSLGESEACEESSYLTVNDTNFELQCQSLKLALFEQFSIIVQGRETVLVNAQPVEIV